MILNVRHLQVKTYKFLLDLALQCGNHTKNTKLRYDRNTSLEAPERPMFFRQDAVG